MATTDCTVELDTDSRNQFSTPTVLYSNMLAYFKAEIKLFFFMKFKNLIRFDKNISL